MTEETYRVLLDAANHVSVSTWDLDKYQQAGAASPDRAAAIMAVLDLAGDVFAAELDAAERLLAS